MATDLIVASRVELIERNSYPSFGQCIYCGAVAANTKLGDEHIIPYSLGGNAVIKKASCTTCAAETSKLERVLARQVLGRYRAHIEEQTRRPADRPKTFKFMASINKGPLTEFEAPTSDAPYFTYMPIFSIPGIYSGAQPAKEFAVSEVHKYWWVPPNIRNVVGAKDGDVVDVPDLDFRLQHELFARAIAKIAYCQAVARYGLDGFRRLVTPQLILGQYPFVPYFVGSSIDIPPPPGPRTAKHGIVLHYTNIHRMNLLTASVRLYANSGTQEVGMPYYDVVIGAPRTR